MTRTPEASASSSGLSGSVQQGVGYWTVFSVNENIRL
jgi:hypothetical protein